MVKTNKKPIDNVITAHENDPIFDEAPGALAVPDQNITSVRVITPGAVLHAGGGCRLPDSS